jgi:hypothetical protein
MEPSHNVISLRRWILRTFMIGLVLMMTPPNLQAQRLVGDELALSLRNNVVSIVVKREGGEEEGFGFIIGRRADKLFIVTANHVVRGRDPKPEDRTPRVTVEYFQDRGQFYNATLHGTSYPSLDLAVLEAKSPQGVRENQQVVGSQKDVQRGIPVWFIGRTRQWFVPSIPGRINEVTADLKIIVENLDVQPGTSGAPLIAESGIIGMIVEDEAGLSRALPIEIINRAIEGWNLPWDLKPLKETPPPNLLPSPVGIQKPFVWVLDRSQTLKIVDYEGKQIREIAKVNIDLSGSGKRVMSVSHNGEFAVAVNAYNVVDKLARYNIDGSIPWSIKSGSYSAVAVADTGYVYTIKYATSGSTKDIVQKIHSQTGEVVKQIELPKGYSDIVVDEKNENVWVAGQGITRLDLDLNEQWTTHSIGLYVVSVDYAPDGTLLAAERQVGKSLGQDRLLRIGTDGKILNSFPLDFSPLRVVVNRGYWDVWVVGILGNTVVRFNPKDPSWDKPHTFALGPATYADVSRDGSAWIAVRDSNKILRVSRQGKVMNELAGFVTEQMCLAVVSD